MVYILKPDNGELMSSELTALDGDYQKVQPLDFSDDGGAKVRPSRQFQGRWLETTHMPTRVKISGPKRKLPDMYEGFNWFAGERFKEVLEGLEPGVHQFVPVEFVWKDGSPAANMFWFAPGNRIDSADSALTTYPLHEGRVYLQSGGGRFVFSNAKIGNRHVWIDKHWGGQTALNVSDEFLHRLQAAGVSGFKAVEAEAV